jgi:FHA domain
MRRLQGFLTKTTGLDREGMRHDLFGSIDYLPTWGEAAMATAVRLTVLSGPQKNRRFCFCGPTQCQMGRASDCFVQLSGRGWDQFLSRHHCQLDIAPPSVQVHDLGSKNGTFVNGKQIGASRKDPTKKSDAAIKSGDLITVGGTTLRIDILDCPHGGNDFRGESIWRDGETAKKDCPLPC